MRATKSRRRARLLALLPAAVGVLGSAPLAALVDGGCPDPAGHEQQIIRGEVLLKLVESPGSAAKEGCVLGFIPAAPGSVMAVLREADQYDEYMPRVAKSDLASGPDGEVLNTQELDLPWPIGDRHFTVRLMEEPVSDGGYRYEFTYVAGSGNIKDTRGHWLIEPWHDGSRVTYSLWTDPGGMIPKWAINRASRETLPEVIVALRERVEERARSAGR